MNISEMLNEELNDLLTQIMKERQDLSDNTPRAKELEDLYLKVTDEMEARKMGFPEYEEPEEIF